MNNSLAILAALVLLTAGVSQSIAQGNKADQAKAASQKRAVYLCPMHSDVTSDKPGKCPKCGMTLVQREEKKESADNLQTLSESSSAKEKIQLARSLLADAKKDLTQDGKYNCCIKDPCDRCALDHQSCPCANDVKAGKAVCPDCYAGWQRGDGIVKGVNPKKVKGSFHRHHHDD